MGPYTKQRQTKINAKPKTNNTPKNVTPPQSFPPVSHLDGSVAVAEHRERVGLRGDSRASRTRGVAVRRGQLRDREPVGRLPIVGRLERVQATGRREDFSRLGSEACVSETVRVDP